MIQNQRRRRIALPIDPVELSIQTVSRRCEEIRFGIVKGHSLGNVTVLLRQSEHQPGKKCGVSDLVDNGWAGWQRAILDAQVSDTIRNAITGTVPAPHCAIVHSQRGQQWSSTPCQHLKRIFIRLRNHDWPEARNLIVKKRNDGMFQPTFPKTNSGWLTTYQLRTRS